MKINERIYTKLHLLQDLLLLFSIAGFRPLGTRRPCSLSRPDVSTGCLGIATRRGLQQGEETCIIPPVYSVAS